MSSLKFSSGADRLFARPPEHSAHIPGRGAYTDLYIPNRKGSRFMQDEKHDEELRQTKGQGDVDDLIFYGESQPNISDR